MKAIKFRMWNNVGLNPKKSKYFYDADMVMECLKQQMIFDQNPDNKLGYNHIGEGNSFEEFTGRQDSKGVDIYHKDVIEFDRKEWSDDTNIHIVTWDNNNSQWDWGGGSAGDMDFRTVIGNIHENPNK